MKRCTTWRYLARIPAFGSGAATRTTAAGCLQYKPRYTLGCALVTPHRVVSTNTTPPQVLKASTDKTNTFGSSTSSSCCCSSTEATANGPKAEGPEATAATPTEGDSGVTPSASPDSSDPPSKGEAAQKTASGPGAAEGASDSEKSGDDKRDKSSEETKNSEAKKKEEEKEKEKKEEVEEAEVDEDQDDGKEDLSTSRPPKTDKERLKLSEQLIKKAEDRILYSEILAPENISEYIDVTELTTRADVRWTDVCARPKLLRHSFLKRQTEAQFTVAVIKKLQQLEQLPPGVYESITEGQPLPGIQVDENWVSMVLRTPKNVDPVSSNFASVLFKNVSSMEGNDNLASARYAELVYQETKEQEEALGRGTRAEKKDAAGAQRKTPSPEVLDDSNEKQNRETYYDEDTNEYYVLNTDKRKQWSLLQSLRNTFTPLKTKVNSTKKGKKGSSTRGLGGRQGQSFKAPSITDLTDRLTILIFREIHPMDNYLAELKAKKTEALAAGEGLVTPFMPKQLVNVIVDQHGNISTNFLPDAHAPQRDADKAGKSEAHVPHYRWRIVTVHRSPAPFLKTLQRYWHELTVPLSQALHGDDDAAQRNVEVRHWEDIVRLLFYGTVRELNDSAGRCMRMLDYFEGATFQKGVSNGGAEHLRFMTSMMTELHSLTRQARLFANMLQESGVAFRKLKRTLDSPLTVHDKAYLSFLESAVALSNMLEEQSESLLFLQFSVAMNEMERSLRTLTIFSTVFIPINFVVSLCSTNFDAVAAWRHSDSALSVLVFIIISTSVVTYRWIITRF